VKRTPAAGRFTKSAAMPERERLPDISTLIRGEKSDAILFLDWVADWRRSHVELLESWETALAAEQSPPAVREDALHSLHVSAVFHAQTVERPFLMGTGIWNVFGVDVIEPLGRALRELANASQLVAESPSSSVYSDALLLGRFTDAHQVAKAPIRRAVQLLGVAGRERGWNLVAGNHPPSPSPQMDVPFTSSVSAADLARFLRDRGYSAATDDAVRAFLQDYRDRAPDCFVPIEREDRRRNEARYLYRPEVWPVLVRHFDRRLDRCN
jgi:hypothetical protein